MWYAQVRACAGRIVTVNAVGSHYRGHNGCWTRRAAKLPVDSVRALLYSPPRPPIIVSRASFSLGPSLSPHTRVLYTYRVTYPMERVPAMCVCVSWPTNQKRFPRPYPPNSRYRYCCCYYYYRYLPFSLHCFGGAVVVHTARAFLKPSK